MAETVMLLQCGFRLPLTLRPIVVKERHMPVPMPRKLFVNLAVRDLKKSTAFFAALGFTYEPQFTDENAACMIVSDEAFVMLLAEPFFKGFTRKQICDTGRQTEALLAISCASRAEVDQIVKKAVSAGGSHAMEPMDHGFMYGWSFYVLDRHHWEVMWMDPAAIQPTNHRTVQEPA
jgi:predicted lactoylglutathione lyase